jgi:hypothetical protein
MLALSRWDMANSSGAHEGIDRTEPVFFIVSAAKLRRVGAASLT